MNSDFIEVKSFISNKKFKVNSFYISKLTELPKIDKYILFDLASEVDWSNRVVVGEKYRKAVSAYLGIKIDILAKHINKLVEDGWILKLNGCSYALNNSVFCK